MPPSAMTGTPESCGLGCTVHDGRQLRNADARNDAGGADRSRPDSHLDGIGAGIDQRARRFGRGNVAGDHLHLVGQPLDALDLIDDVNGMAMSGIDDHGIDAGVDEDPGTFEPLVAGPGRGGDTQAALLVLGGVGMLRGLLHVGDSDQADAMECVVDDDELLDAMLVQEPLRLGAARRRASP